MSSYRHSPEDSTPVYDSDDDIETPVDTTKYKHTSVTKNTQMNDYDDDDDIVLPTHSSSQPTSSQEGSIHNTNTYNSQGKQLLIPSSMSTAKTMDLGTPTDDEIRAFFHGQNGLHQPVPDKAKIFTNGHGPLSFHDISSMYNYGTGGDGTIGLTAKTFDSFHSSTAQVAFDANASISYRGAAKMLDTGTKVSDEVKAKALELAVKVNDHQNNVKRGQSQQIVNLFKVELEGIREQLRQDEAKGHILASDEKAKLLQRQDAVLKQIADANELNSN